MGRPGETVVGGERSKDAGCPCTVALVRHQPSLPVRGETGDVGGADPSGYGSRVHVMPSVDRSMKPSCDSASIQRLASASQPARACEIAVTPPGPKSRPLTSATRCHVAPSLVVQIPPFRLGRCAERPDEPEDAAVDGPGLYLQAAGRRRDALPGVPSRDRMNRASTCWSSPANEPAGPTAMNHSPTRQMLVTSGWLPMSCSAQSRLATGVVVGDVVTTGDGDVVGIVADARRTRCEDDRGCRPDESAAKQCETRERAPRTIRTIASASRGRRTSRAPDPRVARCGRERRRQAVPGRHPPARDRRTARAPRSGGFRSVVGSVMVEVRPEALEQASEARSDAGGGAAELGGDLGRIEAGDVAERDEAAVVGIEATQRTLEVDEVDGVGRVAARRARRVRPTGRRPAGGVRVGATGAPRWRRSRPARRGPATGHAGCRSAAMRSTRPPGRRRPRQVRVADDDVGDPWSSRRDGRRPDARTHLITFCGAPDRRRERGRISTAASGLSE